MERLLLSLVFVCSFALPIVAQERVIEEIIVTTTKKEASTQDLPISIEALSSEALEERQIFDVQSLSQQVPGLIHSKALGSGTSINIRGSGPPGVGASVVDSVVSAINGHSVTNSILSDAGFLDLDRVEVLKGPQGTLNGRNAVGGLINYIPKRPGNEFGGYAKVRLGDFDLAHLQAAIDIPLSDSVRTRIAVQSYDRDGWVYNVHTKNQVDDRSQMDARLSIDWDINDTTLLELTYQVNEGEDKRFNIGQIYCDKDPLMGCDPYTLGKMGQGSHSAGAFGGAFYLIANLIPAATYDMYQGAYQIKDIDEVNHNIDPRHNQKFQFGQIKLSKELESGTIEAKVSYDQRDYYHHQDNEYNVGVGGLPGTLGSLGLPPIGFDATFGFSPGSHMGQRQLQMYVTQPMQLEFANVDQNVTQSEITYISDLDGPVNFVVGWYDYGSAYRNDYLVQSAGIQMMGSFAQHPYNSLVIPGFTGGADFTGYGGVPFYTAFTLGALPNAAAGDMLAFAQALGGLFALPKYENPITMRGFFSNDHGRISNTALFGEAYIDISEATKLTLGFRQDEFTVSNNQFSDLGDLGAGTEFYKAARATGANHMDFRRYPKVINVVESDDTSYKIALQQYLSEDVMTFISFTTAVKAGGTNPNEKGIIDAYEKEEVEYLEVGIKGSFLDDRMLASLIYYAGDHTNQIVSAITDAGSRNTNLDATNEGLEGQITYLLTDNTRVDFSFTSIESEVGSGQSQVDPLNITGGTMRVPIPAGVLPWGDADAGKMASIVPGSNGLMQVGFTDKGPVYKFAGYACTVPTFNPLGQVFCPDSAITLTDIGGNSLPGIPELSYNLGITHDFVVDGGTYTLGYQYSWMDSRFADIFNNPGLEIDETEFSDLTLTYTPNDESYYIGFWVKNIDDDRSIQSIYKASNLQGGAKFGNHNDPRTMGISFGVNF